MKKSMLLLAIAFIGAHVADLATTWLGLNRYPECIYETNVIYKHYGWPLTLAGKALYIVLGVYWLGMVSKVEPESLHGKAMRVAAWIITAVWLAVPIHNLRVIGGAQ